MTAAAVHSQVQSTPLNRQGPGLFLGVCLGAAEACIVAEARQIGSTEWPGGQRHV